MEITCDIIRDLLPLYAEDLVSSDTRALVDDHLCKCDPCTKQLGILKKAAQLPLDLETHSLERVSCSIRKQRILTVVCVLFTILSLIWSFSVFLGTPIYLSAEKAIEGVALREDGGLAIDLARGCFGVYSYDFGERDKVVGVITSRYDWYQGRAEQKRLDGMSEEELEAYVKAKYKTDTLTQREWDNFNNISKSYIHVQDVKDKYVETWPISSYDLWYMTAEGDQTLIWNGGDGTFNAEYAFYHDYGHTARQFTVGIVFSVILAAVFLMFAHVCKNARWKEIIFSAGTVFACFAGAFCIITGFDFSDYLGCRAARWDHYFVQLTAVLSVTALLWRRLYLLNRRNAA